MIREILLELSWESKGPTPPQSHHPTQKNTEGLTKGLLTMSLTPTNTEGLKKGLLTIIIIVLIVVGLALGGLGFPHSGCVGLLPRTCYKNLKNTLIEEASLPSGKLRWQWKVPLFSKVHVEMVTIFHGNVSLLKCIRQKIFKKHYLVQATPWKSPLEFQTRLRKCKGVPSSIRPRNLT